MRPFALLLLASCGGTPTDAREPLDSGATYVPGDAWRTASPASAGFSSDAMAQVRRDISGGRYGAIDAVVMVRHGYVVHEQYVGWSPTRAHTLQSVTKSVTALLFGIAAEQQGATAALDRPVLEVMNRYAPVANVDQRKQALTLRHLLGMRTAMDFWEQPYPDSPLDSLNRSSGDWVRFILDRRMTGEPGSQWAYNSGATILICGVIRELTGEPVESFARRELFAPIGITGETWFRSPFDGLPHCGGGLSLRPRDLARIGYLVLRRGRWGDRQIVPETWIDQATRPHSTGPSLFFAGYGSGYGYYWWLFPSRPGHSDHAVIAGSGAGGQWLFVVPELDLVVAIAASQGDGLGLLYQGVLPALTGP
jgi:CubicO group peptidase (beta-lactamase class C family)